MAQKEILEIIGRVNESGQAVPETPVTPANPRDVAAVQPEDMAAELTAAAESMSDAATKSLQDALQEAIGREAQLRILREVNASIKQMLASPPQGPPEEPPDDSGGGFNFDDEDFNFNNLPDDDSDEQRRIFEELMDWFREFNTPYSDIDQDEKDRLTEEFDADIAFDPASVKDDIDELTVAFDAQLEAMNRVELSWLNMFGTVGQVTVALTGLVVGTELYIAALNAIIDTIGEFSAELKAAQAETEIQRTQQQLEFADRFGGELASLEDARSDLASSVREFRSQFVANTSSLTKLLTTSLEGIFTILNLILDLIRPITFVIEVIAEVLNAILKGVIKIVNFITFNWFEKDDTNLDTFRDLIDPDVVGLKSPQHGDGKFHGNTGPFRTRYPNGSNLPRDRGDNSFQDLIDANL